MCDAGCDLLHHYQSRWSELHRASEDAARVADSLDRLVAATGDRIARSQAAFSDLEVLATKGLTEIEKSASEIARDLSQTLACLQELEQVMQLREETVFQADARKRFDTQYVLKIHEEKLSREFAKIAVSLKSDHEERVKRLKMREELVIKEKQESFRRAFEKELMQYKTDGRIRRPRSGNPSASSVSLEQILVEPDERERLSLEQFLEEESSPQSDD